MSTKDCKNHHQKTVKRKKILHWKLLITKAHLEALLSTTYSLFSCQTDFRICFAYFCCSFLKNISSLCLLFSGKICMYLYFVPSYQCHEQVTSFRTGGVFSNWVETRLFIGHNLSQIWIRLMQGRRNRGPERQSSPLIKFWQVSKLNLILQKFWNYCSTSTGFSDLPTVLNIVNLPKKVGGDKFPLPNKFSAGPVHCERETSLKMDGQVFFAHVSLRFIVASSSELE